MRSSCTPRRADENALIMLITSAGGFVGTHVSHALKKCGDGVVDLDNFNNYYEVSLKRARQALLEKHDVFVVEGDINDKLLLESLFEVVQFTPVMHLKVSELAILGEVLFGELGLWRPSVEVRLACWVLWCFCCCSSVMPTSATTRYVFRLLFLLSVCWLAFHALLLSVRVLFFRVCCAETPCA